MFRNTAGADYFGSMDRFYVPGRRANFFPRSVRIFRSFRLSQPHSTSVAAIPASPKIVEKIS